MYPNFYYLFKDWFGVEWNFLRVVNSFGFFVAVSFILGAWMLTVELKRKGKEGIFKPTEETIEVGKPAGTLTRQPGQPDWADRKPVISRKTQSSRKRIAGSYEL